VSGIDEVTEHVKSREMLDLLIESRKHHEKLGNDLHEMLNKQGTEEKDPSPIAKGMSWMKTNVKIGMDNSDATIADLITDGCDMGIKSLNKYMNKYESADEKAKSIAKRLAASEEYLELKMRPFL
jgi:hypothetical protein